MRLNKLVSLIAFIVVPIVFLSFLDVVKSPFNTVMVVSVEKAHKASIEKDPSVWRAYSKWKVTKEDMEQFFKEAKVIDGHEWHYYYAQYNCFAEGLVILDKMMYRYSIDAGGNGSVWTSDTSFRLGLDTNYKHTVFWNGRFKDEDMD